jgi:hypothetical protein
MFRIFGPLMAALVLAGSAHARTDRVLTWSDFKKKLYESRSVSIPAPTTRYQNHL